MHRPISVRSVDHENEVGSGLLGFPDTRHASSWKGSPIRLRRVDSARGGGCHGGAKDDVVQVFHSTSPYRLGDSDGARASMYSDIMAPDVIRRLRRSRRRCDREIRVATSAGAARPPTVVAVAA
jgi:hypothetical protein